MLYRGKQFKHEGHKVPKGEFDFFQNFLVAFVTFVFETP